MSFAFAVAVVAILLILSEIWWRGAGVHHETSRKFVHITVGSFVAIWPFFLSWNDIRILSLLFLVGVVLSKYLHILRAIHSVQRPTWGEIFFAIAVGVVTFVTHVKWIYMAALLQMSLADGLAAIVGVRYGQPTRYKILGHTKSLVGSLVCFGLSLAILIYYAVVSGNSLNAYQVFGLSAGVTLFENFSFYGLDNLVIPVLVAAALASL